jgi:DNA-binding MarR family transcriptional regulator
MGETLKKRLLQTRFDHPIHEAVLNLLVASGYVRERTERLCAEHGITMGQFNVLRILRGAHPNGQARCEVARRLVDRAPDVTRLIDRLEAQGLVERGKSEEDRRLSLTRITRKGLRVLDDVQPAFDAMFEDFSTRLSTEDAEELSRICEALYGNGLD